MTFLQSSLLWGLPLVFLPIIIHFIHRLRHRTVKWAAMLFLLQAQRSSTKFAKLRQILILLCRMAALLFLIFALARPLAGGWLGWMLSGPPETVILLVDRSASMAGTDSKSTTSKLKKSLDMFAAAGKKLRGKSKFIIIDNVRPSPLELNSLDLLKDKNIMSATNTAANYNEMLQNAYNYIKKQKTGTTEIWIASDMQASNWTPHKDSWRNIYSQFVTLPQKVKFRLLNLDTPIKNNNSVTIKEIKRYYINGNFEIDVAYQIDRSGQSLSTIPVTIIINGTAIHKELHPKGKRIIAHQTIKLNPDDGSGWGEIIIPQDNNPADNQAYFAYGKPCSMSAAVVSDDPNQQKYLQLATSPANKLLQQSCTTFLSRNFNKIPFANLSLIVWQAKLPNKKQQKQLQNFVESGGVLLMLPNINRTGILFDKFGFNNIENSHNNTPFKITYWQQESGLLSHTADGQSLPIDAIEVYKRQEVTGPQQSLAQFSDGKNFITRHILGTGQIIFLTTLPDNQWSNIQKQGLVLIPILQRLFYAGNKRFSNICEEKCGVYHSNHKLAQLNHHKKKFNTANDSAGIYSNQEQLIVINRPISEDITDIIDKTDIKKIFKDLKITTLRNKTKKESNLQSELWHKLILAVFIVLIIEGLLTINKKPENMEVQ